MFDIYAQKVKESLDLIDIKRLQFFFAALLTAIKTDKDIFIIGNGACATLSDHFALSLMKDCFTKKGEVFPISVNGLRAKSLMANTSIVSAWANDTDYSLIFAHQLKAEAKPSDLLIALSGSGNSPNIIEGIMAAKNIGMHTSGFIGMTGGRAKELLDICIHVPCSNIAVCEDIFSVLIHTTTEFLKENIVVKGF